MYMQVNETNFIDTFKAMGRMKTETSREGNFTLEGLRALFAYLEQAEEDNGREFELDPIALCCQFAEYNCAIDALCDLQPGMVADFEEQLKTGEESPAELHDIIEDACRDYLRDNPFLIEFDGGVIVDTEW